MNMKKITAFAAAVVMASGILAAAPADRGNAPLLAVTAEAKNKTGSDVPANFKTKKTDNSVTLSWDAVDGADMYRVYKYNSKTKKYEKYKDVKTAKCTIKKLSAGTKYKFKVVAYTKNASGKYVKGKSSKEISVTTSSLKSAGRVGNDTAGYITAYFDYKYTKNKDGSFSIVSGDGKDRTDVFFYNNLQTDLDQTAYMFCLTALMNAEEDGYEATNMSSVKLDGMNGYFAVAIDDDEGTGFKLYLTLVDSKNEMIRFIMHESTRLTEDNVIAAANAFDSYKLKK